MMIYHIDETQSGNDHQWYPAYTDSGHYKVALEQADGDWDLEHDINSGDTGDPFPGSTANRSFNNSTTPDSKNYAFGATYVAVANISNSGHVMTADLGIANAPSVPGPVCRPMVHTPTIAVRFSISPIRPGPRFIKSRSITIRISRRQPFNVANLINSQYTPTSDLSDAYLLLACASRQWPGLVRVDLDLVRDCRCHRAGRAFRSHRQRLQSQPLDQQRRYSRSTGLIPPMSAVFKKRFINSAIPRPQISIPRVRSSFLRRET